LVLACPDREPHLAHDVEGAGVVPGLDLMSTAHHIFIAMADGVRLAASLFRPDGDAPWPAILEALPYRKDDDTSSYRREYERLADAGYVVCRVDLRGTGSSEGVAEDEYPAVERSDLLTVIDWLATQSWSTGSVGMYGTSYSGFNSIQLAMERPPALKAIIPIFATDDRYGDDAHYFGGALKQLDLVDYPTYMIAMNALPPVPSIFGEGWRDEWERRVTETEPWVLTWLAHQRHDDYWQFGSLRPDYGRIEAATMIVAGWADGYRNNSLRTFEQLRCPARVVLGPWAHASTDTSLPGPNIDLVPEMLRWWDRWLKGVDNGIDREPPIALFAQRSTRPGPTRPEMRGEWRYEPGWPATRLRPSVLALTDADGPASAAPGPDVLEVRGDVGWTAWISCAAQLPWGQPADQRPDEAFSLAYTWPALDEELEILGHARLTVNISSSAPIAYLSAKLCDVFPDGVSSLVARGMLNLAHRDSRDDPTPLEPDRAYEVAFDLEVTSWTFEAGHRVRLDLAGTDWPNAATPPVPLTLSIDRARSSIMLPVVVGASPSPGAPSFAPPRRADHAVPSRGRDAYIWRIEHDVPAGATRAVVGNSGDYPATDDTPSYAERYEGTVTVRPDDPGAAAAHGEAAFEIRWPEATCTSRATLEVDSDADTYRVRIDLTVTEDGDVRWHRRWDRTIPRDHQ
jgi:putative CocE/NonD family hydrolase